MHLNGLGTKANNVKYGACWISKWFFGYALKIYRQRIRRNLEISDIYAPMRNDCSELLAAKLEKNWNEELLKCELNAKYNASLLKALLRTFKYELMLQGLTYALHAVLYVFIPLIVCRLIFIYRTIDDEHPAQERTILTMLLIVAIFIRISINDNMQLSQLRLGVKCKVACSALIYRKILKLNESAFSDTISGQVINLLSNDASRFEQMFIYIHALWFLPIQLTMITYCLWLNVKLACIIGVTSLALMTIPMQIIISRLTNYCVKKIVSLTDKRLLMMNEILSGIQVIKMYAWEVPFTKLVQAARASEVKWLKRNAYIRGFYIGYFTVIGRFVLCITVTTLVLLGEPLAAETIFTMTLFFDILQIFMSIHLTYGVSNASELLISIERMRKLLVLPEKDQHTASKRMLNLSMNFDEGGGNGIVNAGFAYSKATDNNEHAIKLCNVHTSYETFQLSNINVNVAKKQKSVIIGTTGCGKTVLLNLIAREVTVERGVLKTNGTVSYCCQEPWLFAGTVRDNIIFDQIFDETKYRDVVRACALEKDFEQLVKGDSTLVGDHGSQLSGGQKARVNLARAIYKNADIYILDDPLSAVDTLVAHHIINECIKKYLAHKTVLLSTHQVQFVKEFDQIVLLDKGNVQLCGTYDEFANSHIKLNHAHDGNESDNALHERRDQNGSAPDDVSDDASTQDNDESKRTGIIGWQTYVDYWRYGASWPRLIFLLAIIVVHQFIANFSDVWLAMWIDANVTNVANVANVARTQTNNDDHFEQNTYLYIYAMLNVLVIVFVSIRAALFFDILIGAAKHLHNKMLHVLIAAPMRFFDSNPSGRIVNRFSKDLGVLDDALPRAITCAIMLATNFIGMVVVVLYVNIWMFIPLLIMFAFFYVLTKIYTNTAQDLKRIESIAKSPVFSHTNSTISGLVTIRARNSEKHAIKVFDHHQNVHTGAYYQVDVANMAFSFWVDFSCLTFVSVQLILFLTASKEAVLETGGSRIGLVISQALMLSQCTQFCLRGLVEVICLMTNVERVMQYTKLEQEGPFESRLDKKKPAKTWPSNGLLKFNSYSIKYGADQPLALTNVTLQIRPKEKIGIIGRTGAGKSTFISSLFRLAISDGQLLIDDVDIDEIGLRDLRSKISIIPQVPVLFAGSIRTNLDPFNEFTDELIWAALGEVELKDNVTNLEDVVLRRGSNFSLGQRQLLCLARAILRKNSILILDEATANVDSRTDALIQKTIREKFRDCTVLTIAHRLITVLDSDRIIVMDSGKVIEFDRPLELLKSPQSYFSKMVRNSTSETKAAVTRMLQQVNGLNDLYIK